MSLEVSVLASFAVALRLFLSSREENVVGVEVEPDRNDLFHLDDSGLRFRAGARLDGAEGIVAKPLRPGWADDRYV